MGPKSLRKLRLWRRDKVGCMLAQGERAPEVSFWIAPNERQTLAEILDGAPALFLFYLFDWSST